MRYGWYSHTKYHKRHLWFKHDHGNGVIVYKAACGISHTLDPKLSDDPENNPCKRCLGPMPKSRS